MVDCFFVDFVEECMEMSLSDVERPSDLFSVRGLDVFLHWTESCWIGYGSLKRANCYVRQCLSGFLEVARA